MKRQAYNFYNSEKGELADHVLEDTGINCNHTHFIPVVDKHNPYNLVRECQSCGAISRDGGKTWEKSPLKKAYDVLEAQEIYIEGWRAGADCKKGSCEEMYASWEKSYAKEKLEKGE